MYILLIIGILSTILTIYFAYESVHGRPTDFTLQIIFSIIYSINEIIVLLLLIYSVVIFFKGNKKLNAGSIIFLCLLSISAIVYARNHDPQELAEKKRVEHDAKLIQWRHLGETVNPLLREYYFKYPTRFTFPYSNSEAQIDGFAGYAHQHGIPLVNGKIVDPWGDPVLFVIATNSVNYFKFKARNNPLFGTTRIGASTVSVGLLLEKPNRLETRSSEQWSMENGLGTNSMR